MNILLTGASGFLGSHIAELLCESEHKLLLVKRDKSDLWRCSSFINKVNWTNTDSNMFESEVLSFSPEVIINSAWDGVSASNRNHWETQICNLVYQQRLLNLAKVVKLKKFIGIGSQSEYGNFEGRVDEDYSVNPCTAYGAIKQAAYLVQKVFCKENNIPWYWFRLFSSFGEREGDNWLIPSTVNKMLTENKMDLTFGEQQYSYLYIKDVAKVFLTAVEKNAESGIYHIASDTLRPIKDILLVMRDFLNPCFDLNFGALPYRANQSMINGSINTKTRKIFGKVECSGSEEKLVQTMEYYKKIYNAKR